MAKKKYKLTGFAKFFMVMVVLAPIAFFAAIYINEGEEGLNDLFKNNDSPKTEVRKKVTTSGNATLADENEMLKDSIRKLNLEYNELKTRYRLLEKAADGQ